MKIEAAILQRIFRQILGIPSESGGIFGSKGDIISNVEFDKGISKLKCAYEPNIDFLNEVIERWQEENIDFAGIFHTHFFGVETLSQGDIAYITAIMSAVPESINQLYFPIVLPEYHKMIPYIATKDTHGIQICKDELMIVDNQTTI